MHIRFGCLATNLLDFFYKHTTLRCYGNYVSDEYLTKIWLQGCHGQGKSSGR